MPPALQISAITVRPPSWLNRALDAVVSTAQATVLGAAILGVEQGFTEPALAQDPVQEQVEHDRIQQEEIAAQALEQHILEEQQQEHDLNERIESQRLLEQQNTDRFIDAQTLEKLEAQKRLREQLLQPQPFALPSPRDLRNFYGLYNTSPEDRRLIDGLVGGLQKGRDGGWTLPASPTKRRAPVRRPAATARSRLAKRAPVHRSAASSSAPLALPPSQVRRSTGPRAP